MTRSITVLSLGIIVAITLSCQSLHFNSLTNNNPGYPSPSSSSTFTAASCSYTDVSDCINGIGANTCRLPGGGTGTHQAINGDTIEIPAGTCTYTSELTISVLINFLGADPSNASANRGSGGGGQTVLIDHVDKSVCNTSKPMIHFTNESQGNGPMELGNFTVKGDVNFPDSAQCSEHVFIQTASHTVRIHDMTFSALQSTGLLINGDEWGVGDHNTFTPDTAFKRGFLTHHERWQENGSNYGDNSWAQPDTMGTEQAMFWENNVFRISNPSGVGNVACEYGARCVVRYNDIETGGTHGTDTSGRDRSVRQQEWYNNNINDNGNLISGGVDQWRGGTGVFFNNTITPQNHGSYNAQLSLAIYRRPDGMNPWGPQNVPWNGKGGCWGNSPFDTNDGVIYFSGMAGNGSTTDNLVDTKPNFGASNSLIGYSVINTTNSWGSLIISNTSTSIQTQVANSSLTHTWTVGDNYQVLRSTRCIDQPGAGAGPLLTGQEPTPSAPVNEALDPVYAWGNQYCHPTCSVVTPQITGKDNLIANHDYYDFVVSGFNGTVGTGQGLLSERPSKCTPLVAYWATDMNTLFQCDKPNTWVQYYTPYIYPHPLTVSTSQ